MDIEEKPSLSTQSEIRNLLANFNREQVGDDEHELISLSISESDELIAGLVGGTYWGYMYVDSLVVIEEHRGAGLGRSLLLRAEEIAISRGCMHSNIDSHDFQGYRFYLKFGYEIIGRLPDLPHGNFKYHLYKQLKAS